MKKNREDPGRKHTGSDPAPPDERHRSEAALRSALARFEAIIENTPGVAIPGFDRTGRILHWNPACETVYGYTWEEVKGRRFQDFALEGRGVERFEQALEDIWRTGRSLPPEEWEVRARDGSARWLYSTMFPIFEGDQVSEVFCMDVDITERRRAENALRQREADTQALINAIPDLVFLYDREGRYVRFHAPQEELLYTSPEQFLGRSVDEVLPDDVARATHAYIDAALKSGQAQVFEYELDIRDEVKSFEARLVKYGEDLMLAVVRDITERKRAEEERQQARRMESLSIMAGGIAHDFNNLLTTIMGNISLIRLSSKVVDESVRRYLEAAEKAALRAGLLTQQLMVFTRGGAPVTQPVSVPDLVHDALSVVRPDDRIRYECQLPGDLWKVKVDAVQIGQVIMNLLVNAAEAMPDGGLITIRAENVSEEDSGVRVADGRYVRLSIKDAGAGMTREQQGRIFDPYYSTKEKGHGLGLPVCYAIVQKHGGRMDVKSRPGMGTEVSVYLPAADKESAENPGPATGAAAGARARILVMDDEVAICQLAARALEKNGYEVEMAASGEEAIRVYRKARDDGHPFDAVILDVIVAGGMGGPDVLRELRKEDPDVKAVLSTGVSGSLPVKAAGDPDFAAVLSKPYTIEELLQTISKVLGLEKKGT